MVKYIVTTHNHHGDEVTITRNEPAEYTDRMLMRAIRNGKEIKVTYRDGSYITFINEEK